MGTGTRSRSTTILASKTTRPPRLRTPTAGAGAVVACLIRTCFWARASATPLYDIATRSNRGGGGDVTGRHDEPKLSTGFTRFGFIGVAVCLVLLGGMFAGLTIALMSQDETHLTVIARSGEGSERKNAARVLWLLKKGKHWVLVTLLLGNVITNETLPVVLDRSLGAWLASCTLQYSINWWVLAAIGRLEERPALTTKTVIFGEIAPQAICVRHGLSIGAFFSSLVLALMWLISPIAWPTAKLLDRILGDDQHGVLYKKAGLKALIELHLSLGAERLNQDEVTIIKAVLDLKEKPVRSIMTPLAKVYTLSADAILNQDVIIHILSEGHSRIPVYMPGEKTNFIGMLLVKSLITYDPKDRKRVRDFTLINLPETQPDFSCLDALNYLQQGKSHMMLVSAHPGSTRGALGVVTLEDVMEELIGEEIVDESDVFIDVHRGVRRPSPAPNLIYRNQAGSERAESTIDLLRSSIDGDDTHSLLSFSHPPQSVGMVERTIVSDGKETTVVEARPVAWMTESESLKLYPVIDRLGQRLL